MVFSAFNVTPHISLWVTDIILTIHLISGMIIMDYCI